MYEKDGGLNWNGCVCPQKMTIIEKIKLREMEDYIGMGVSAKRKVEDCNNS